MNRPGKPAGIAIPLLALTATLAFACRDKSPMAGTHYPQGRKFAQRYCMPCHASVGAHALKKRAYQAFNVDSFGTWKNNRSVIVGVLDRWHLDGKIMPPPEASAQPSDADRRLILSWMERGVPNTVDGRCGNGAPRCP